MTTSGQPIVPGQPPQPPPPVPPQGSFEEQLTRWQGQFQRHSTRYEALLPTVESARKQYAELEQRRYELAKQLPATFEVALTSEYAKEQRAEIKSLDAQIAGLKSQIVVLSGILDRHLFFTDFYSLAPQMVEAGTHTSVDEILTALATPDNLTERELNNLRTEIAQLVASRGRQLDPELTSIAIGGAVPEPTEDQYPSLVAPPTGRELVPVSIHHLTTQELLKSLRTPAIPTTSFTPEEYKAFLASLGWSTEDVDKEIELRKNDLITSIQDRKNSIEAWRNGLFELPERTVMDAMIEVVLTPPLFVLDKLNIYYEYVSMPIAASFWSNFIPDIRKASDDFLRQNPDASIRESWVYAWEQWNAPGSSVFEFVLKNMVMEGLTDPLSYVGWGFANKLFRPLGTAGRILTRANVFASEVMELPFDFAKYLARITPKTITQRAAQSAAFTSSLMKSYYERYSKNHLTFFSALQLSDIESATTRALAHIAASPRSDSATAQLARHLLIHAPVDEEDVVNWITRIRRTGALAIDPDTITDKLLINIDDLFEKVMWHEITPDEAAPLLMNMLGVTYSTDIATDVMYLTARILSDRANGIFDRAPAFLKGAKTAGDAMRRFNRTALEVYEKVETFAARKEVARLGRAQSFVFSLERGTLNTWASNISRFVVRPMAEAYLTFGLYGPMNVIEDILRSTLGGVIPGRATVERFDVATAGLLTDPGLRIPGLSETFGPMGKGLDPRRSNWALMLSTLPVSAPVWAITGGKVTPKAFANATFEFMVERFGLVGQDIRRNYWLGKFSQLLADKGGAAFVALEHAVPDKLPDVLASAPKWVGRNLKKDLYSAVTTGKLTPDNQDLIKALKAKYTSNSIKRAELTQILTKYPDLSPTFRSMAFEAFDERTILASAENIDIFMKEALAAEVDDFLLGPERASQQFKMLADLLTSMEVSNPEEMGQLLIALNRMATTYGMLPDQVMARATIKSRGLPVGDRKLQFDADFDRVHAFMDKAGVDINRVEQKIRDAANASYYAPLPKGFAELESVLERLSLTDPRVTAEVVDNITSVIATFSRIETLNIVDIPASELTKAARILKDASDGSYSIVGHNVFSPFTRRALSDALLPEASHGSIAHAVQLASIELTSGGIPGAWDFVAVLAHEDLSFRIGTEISKVLSSLAAGDITPTPIKRPFSKAVNHYLDLIEAHRQIVADAKRIDMAFRSQYFAKATQKQLRDSSFWNTFYASETAHWSAVSKKLGLINSQLGNAIEEVGVASGATRVARAPIIVRGRALAPADVGKLIGARGDDLSRLLLDALLPEGDRDYFISFIMGKVKDSDAGFTPESVGAVYDQIAASIGADPNSASWFRSREASIQSFGKDLHDMYNANLLPPEQKRAIDNVIDEVARRADEIMFEPIPVPHSKGLLQTPVPDEVAQKAMTEYQETYTVLSAQYSKGLDPAHAGFEIAQREARENAARDARNATIVKYKFENFDPSTGVANYGEPLSKITELKQRLASIGDSVKDETGTSITTYVDDWFHQVDNKALQSLGRLAESSPEYLAAIREVLREQYPDGLVRIYRGSGAAIERGKDPMGRVFTNATSDRSIAQKFEGKYFGDWSAPPSVDNVLVSIDDIIGIGSVDESELILRSDIIKRNVKLPPKTGRPRSQAFQELDIIRQNAADETNKWFYKEFTDYSHANAFDALMKQIYPFWTYESQRFPWLARSFIRHPGTLTTWGRWENNTDYGYVHVPGTSIDANPFRGTVYGPWSTRLMRQDFPEYYDELEGLGGVVGMFDWISRYGFYPNAIYGTLLAQFGGSSSALGGVLPALASTPLNAMIAKFPDNPVVNFISERVFPENFRTYLTSRRVDDLGGDGSLLFAKKSAGQDLTEEEEALWNEARAYTALHSAAFEQFGIFRMRSDQSYALAEASAQFIEETWGVSKEDQRTLRLRGEKLWDIIGGLDPWETAAMQELEFFKYSGSINPVLPSKKQAILTRIEVAWNDVREFSDNIAAEIEELAQDFLVGSARGRLGPDDFLNRVRALYKKRREYIDEKVKTNPLMLLENRTEYYAKYNDPMPVQSPYNELMSMLFSIELEETVDPSTGERIYDWDKFWANHEMITSSIPEEDRAQWDAYLSRNTAPIMQVYHDVYNNYFKKYYDLYETVLKSYSNEEQALINEFLYLERTGQQLERRQALTEVVSADGKTLISGFRSKVSDERLALRYANPSLDAWLFYWHKTTSFASPQGENIYRQLARRTGRVIE